MWGTFSGIFTGGTMAGSTENNGIKPSILRLMVSHCWRSTGVLLWHLGQPWRTESRPPSGRSTWPHASLLYLKEDNESDQGGGQRERLKGQGQRHCCLQARCKAREADTGFSWLQGLFYSATESSLVFRSNLPLILKIGAAGHQKSVAKDRNRNKLVEPCAMRYAFWKTNGSTDKPKSHNISHKPGKWALLGSVDIIWIKISVVATDHATETGTMIDKLAVQYLSSYLPKTA